MKIPANTGSLDTVTVKRYYSQLVRSYLSPFERGISFSDALTVLKRTGEGGLERGTKLSTQGLHVQIKEQKIYIVNPHFVRWNLSNFDENTDEDVLIFKSRANELIYTLSRLAEEHRIPNTEFVIYVHDCIQTSKKKHNYHAPLRLESKAIFSAVSCNFSDNIPFPLFYNLYNHDDDFPEFGFQQWDTNIQHFHETSKQVDWKVKQNMAIFRGKFLRSMHLVDEFSGSEYCDEVGRSKLLFLQTEEPDLLNVSLHGQCGKNEYRFNNLSSVYERFTNKFVIHAEGKCLSSSTLKYLLFGSSVVVRQKSACGQFFEPLLKEDVHYIATDFYFNNLVDSVIRAEQNGPFATNIVRNANEFAWNFLSSRGIEAYIEVLLEQYTKLLFNWQFELHPDAVDVTFKKVF